MRRTPVVIAPDGARYLVDPVEDGWLVTCRNTGIASHARRLEDGLAAAAVAASDEAWVRAAAAEVRRGATYAGGRLHPLDVTVPPMLAGALGYVYGARHVACFFHYEGDELVVTDGTVVTSAEWRTWLLLHAHPHTCAAFKGTDFGSPLGQAREWLLIDRHRCSVSTGVPSWVHAVLLAQGPGPVRRPVLEPRPYPDDSDDPDPPVPGARREGRRDPARVERCVRAFAEWLDREHARRIDAARANGIAPGRHGIGIEP
ncbi:MAG: hypothetical protein AB1416_02330 [Actinomycetota bacterium]